MRWLAGAALIAIGCGGGPSGASQPASLAIVDDQGNAAAALAFGGTRLGQTSTSTVHVINLGASPSGVIAVALTGPDAADFALDPATSCIGQQLAPQQQCDVGVDFMPVLAGARTATLSVAAAPGGSVELPLQGAGASGPMLQLGTLTGFDAVEIGTTASATLHVTNAGDADAAITAIDVAGAPFTQGSSTCAASLAAGASCDVEIRFTPSALGTATGRLTVTADGVAYMAPLTGAGGGRITVAPLGTGQGTITSTPAGISCGTTCSMVATGPIVLAATPSAGSQFAGWSDASCTGTTCTVVPAVTPTTTSATFQLLADGVVLAPAVLDFGLVDVTTSPTRTVQVMNSSSATVDLTAMTVNGARFTLGTSTCTGPLPAGSSCSIDVKFMPTMGSSTGSLVVTASGTDYTSALSGTGGGYISVQKTGTGSGTLTSSPASIDCGPTCSALSPVPVTLIATPDSGSVFAGYENCATPCQVTPGNTPNVVADFELASNYTPLTVDFAGDASGEVFVIDDMTNTTLGDCTGPCTVQIPRNENITVQTASASSAAGLSGACSSGADSCTFMTALPATITATFAKNTGEVWTYLGTAGERAVAAAYDPSGRLVVATSTHLMELDTSGGVIWSIPMTANAVAVPDASSILVIAGGSLEKLDGTGAVQWTVPGHDCLLDMPDPYGGSFDARGFNRCIVVSPAGAIVLSDGTVLDGNGKLLWTADAHPPPSGWVRGYNSIGVDSMGRVFIPDYPTDRAVELMRATRISADGSSSTELDGIGDHLGMMIVDGSDHIASATFDDAFSAELFATDTDGTSFLSVSTQHVDLEGPYGLGVAGLGTTGNLIWVLDPGPTASGGFGVSEVNTAGTTIWGTGHAAGGASPYDYQDLGLNVAVSAAGQIAVVGTYQLGGVDHVWIQVFAP